MLIPVILSGGAGTRLWPLSRELYPKQLLALVGKHTMLQETARRLQGLAIGAPIIVCAEAHRFLVAEQLRSQKIKAQAIILEPVGRNTAPAIVLAALSAQAAGVPDANLLVLPADHVIKDVAAFHAAVHKAEVAARAGNLATFGVVPDAPETGYGYMRRGEASGDVYKIAEFIEKPDVERARKFLAAGDYYWNSGMFLFSAKRFLEEMERYAPDILSSCRAAWTASQHDLDFTRVDAKAFETCRGESVDYAVMEKTKSAVVVPLSAGWSDVGSWAALHDATEHDAHGNSVHGDVIAEDTEGCYLYSESRLVATIGLRDHVVVETKDAVMVAPKNRVQDVKKLVAKIKAEDRYEHSLHREVFRPWGSYDSLDQSDRYQVKRLSVRPGGVLSLQMHHHRAEHWVVVAGTAQITRGDEVYMLQEGESTYIPVGVKHRIENPGKITLHIIAVQAGTYLGEDDIVRYEDRYGRQGSTG